MVRAYHAEQSQFLRNHDAAMRKLQESGVKMHPIVLVLDNVRSAYNVGSIFRTAETSLCSEVRRWAVGLVKRWGLRRASTDGEASRPMSSS